jgi:hypothetical protein
MHIREFFFIPFYSFIHSLLNARKKDILGMTSKYEEEKGRSYDYFRVFLFDKMDNRRKMLSTKVKVLAVVSCGFCRNLQYTGGFFSDIPHQNIGLSAED